MASAAARTIPDVDPIDLSLVICRVMSAHGWDAERLRRAEAGYRDYLELCSAHPGERLIPSRDVDELWHAHILHTRKYMDDCETYLGHYLHHRPSSASEKLSGGPETIRAYEAYFGKPHPDAAELATCGSTGGCDGGDG